jgi:hypothetical protein
MLEGPGHGIGQGLSGQVAGQGDQPVRQAADRAEHAGDDDDGKVGDHKDGTGALDGRYEAGQRGRCRGPGKRAECEPQEDSGARPGNF